MKTCFLLTSFFLINASLLGQERILKLKPGGSYRLYFIDVSLNVDSVETIDTLKHGMVRWSNGKSFLIDEDSTISKLQTSWIGEKTNEIFFCWYDYFLFVVLDNEIVNEVHINEDCKQASFKQDVFKYFTPIGNNLKKDKTVTVAGIEFNSITTGRQFYKDIQHDSMIFIQPDANDKWTIYDGQVTLYTKHGDEAKIQAIITEDIQSQFPDELFEIEQTSWGEGELSYKVYCSSNVGYNLTGYKTFLKWQSFELPTITLFSNSKAAIQNQLRKYAR